MRRLNSDLSIYLHIPFCDHRCSYCAFNTYTQSERLIPAYIDALGRELACVAQGASGRPVHTVYFGGGTPSLLSPAQCDQILSQIGRSFALAEAAEITLEANPDDLSEAYLRDLKSMGFNRLSIGMQSANEAILRLFERQHDLDAVERSVEYARRARFDNVNLDLIFCSPGESVAEWRRTVDTLLRLSPDHVSMYGLELKGGTRLRQRVDAGELPAPDDDDFADMYECASLALAEAGYAQYEISSWRRPGKECRHNLQYWRNLEYIGVGAGAHGFYRGRRYSTIAAPARYIDALKAAPTRELAFEATPAEAKVHMVTEAEDLYETIMMGLRMTREGIDRGHFAWRFGRDFVEMFPAAIERLTAARLIEANRDRVRLTESGRLLSNAVIRQFVSGIKS